MMAVRECNLQGQFRLDYDQHNPFVVYASNEQGYSKISCPLKQTSYNPKYQDRL